MNGVLVPYVEEGATAPVQFIDGDVLCSVEELVIRRSEKCGW